MKIYGKGSRESGNPQSCEEVTLVVSRDEVVDLARFLTECAEEMRSNPDWEHKHLCDFLGQHSAAADIVVFSDRRAA